MRLDRTFSRRTASQPDADQPLVMIVDDDGAVRDTGSTRRRCADGTEGTPLVGSRQEEALAVALRRHTLLPLDDCVCALQPTLPHLTRSSLHHCFLRHGISRLPEVEGSKSKAAFKACPIGFFTTSPRPRTEEGTLHFLVAINRTRKLGDPGQASTIVKSIT